MQEKTSSVLLEMLPDTHKEKRKTLIFTAHLIQSLVLCFFDFFVFLII